MPLFQCSTKSGLLSAGGEETPSSGSASLTDSKAPETGEPISVSLTSSELDHDTEESIDLGVATATSADAVAPHTSHTREEEEEEVEREGITDTVPETTPPDDPALAELQVEGGGARARDSSEYDTPSSSPIPPPEGAGQATGRRKAPESLPVAEVPPPPAAIVFEPLLDKPGLDNQNLQEYFTGSLAQEKDEVLMYVLWCSALLPCTAPNEIEAAILISNITVYLLEVQSPHLQQQQGTSWSSSNLPLAPVLIANLDHISKITITGIFDQNVHVELHDKSPLRSFALFPPTAETSVQIMHQLKAALDACGLHYTNTEAKQSGQLRGISDVVIVNPDSSSMEKLREQLAQDKAVARLSNFIATHKSKNLVGSFEVALRTSIMERAQRMEIAQQLIVNAVSADLLPFSAGRVTLKPLNLILTSEHIFLCIENFLFHPMFHSTATKQAFPQFQMIDSWPIASITGVQMCDKSQVLRSHSDLVYEFTISFEDKEGRGKNVAEDGEGNESHWLLCVHNQAYLARFLESLRHAWKSIHMRELHLVHTTLRLPQFHRYHKLASSPNPPFPALHTPLKSPLGKHRPHPPLFIRSEPLLRFTSLTHSERLKCFKERFALADFLKSDETILSLCLAHCQPPINKKREIEVCVVVSNYGVYLLSDHENIRIWLDAGGVSSFTRMSLLSQDGNSDLQCFFRLWLNDMAKVHAGMLNLCVRLFENKSDNAIDIFTRNLHSTMAFLAALAGVLHLQSPTESDQSSEFLSDYVEINEDNPFGEDGSHSGAVPINVNKRPVEFSLFSAQQLAKLKLHLVENTPAVSQGTSVQKCADSMQILDHQVMLLAEQVRFKDLDHLHYRPHLSLLTNYGLYLCSNHVSPDISPCPHSFSQLVVKKEKWIRIDAIQHVQVAEDEYHGVLQLIISARSEGRGGGVIRQCLVPQNTELTNVFLHFLSLLWRERMGKQLPLCYL